MTISSSKDSNVQDVQFLYSLFHHLEIGDAIPTNPAGLDDIEADVISQLRFKAATKEIVLDSDSESPYTIGIFSLKGTLIATSEMFGGQSLSVERLASGVYIAVASNGETKLSLKFILN